LDDSRQAGNLQLTSHAEQTGIEKDEIPELPLPVARRLYNAYQQSRQVGQLDNAIEYARYGMELTNKTSDLYAAYLANMGMFLGTRYERTGRLDDLRDAIDAARQAVDVTPLNHTDRAGRLNSLGNRLGSRYQRTGQMQDLEDAIDAGRQAVDTTRLGHTAQMTGLHLACKNSVVVLRSHSKPQQQLKELFLEHSPQEKLM
jgi:tetratricopeptide (TPR) repeat protein